MRDKRFISEHRGGSLKKEQHRQLIKWACDCVEHVLPLFGENSDERLESAISVAKEWEKGNATVGDAKKASLAVIALANELTNITSIAIARAVGHAVASAQMADHSPVAALYALKAVKSTGQSVEAERKWQEVHLPSEVKDLVQTAMTEKVKGIKIN